MQINRLSLDQKDTHEWKWLFVPADVHLGEKACDIGLFREELQRARELDARIVIPGDLFGMITPKDPRYQPAGVVKELQNRDDLINATLDYGEREIGPYADLLDMLGIGNHEYSFIKYHSEDIIGELLLRLKRLCKADKRPFRAVHGGYCGYLRYQLHTPDMGLAYDVWYHHGAGGDAPVTKGMIEGNRVRSQWIADLYVMGHNHYRWADIDVRAGLTARGAFYARDVRMVRAGTYRKSYPSYKETQPSHVDFTESSGHSLKPLGGTFVRLRLRCSNGAKRIEQVVEV